MGDGSGDGLFSPVREESLKSYSPNAEVCVNDDAGPSPREGEFGARVGFSLVLDERKRGWSRAIYPSLTPNLFEFGALTCLGGVARDSVVGRPELVDCAGHC